MIDQRSYGKTKTITALKVLISDLETHENVIFTLTFKFDSSKYIRSILTTYPLTKLHNRYTYKCVRIV